MKIIFVYAHPDDESFYSGGTIAKLVNTGQTVKLVCATKGEAGTTGNPPLCKQEELGEVRKKELQKAAKILGVSETFFLGYADGSLKTVPLKILSKKIHALVLEEKPDVVVTFNKEGGSRHPDHKQISKATTNAFLEYIKKTKKRVRLYYADIPRSYVNRLKELGTLYTYFGKVKGTPDEDVTTTVDVSGTIDKKIKAFQCHKTQRNDWELFLKRKSAPEFTKEFFSLALENEIV